MLEKVEKKNFHMMDRCPDNELNRMMIVSLNSEQRLSRVVELHEQLDVQWKTGLTVVRRRV